MIQVNGFLFAIIPLEISIQKGCPIAPLLYVLAVDALGYLFEYKCNAGLIKWIILPNSSSQLFNGHFVNDYFLTLSASKDILDHTLDALDIFNIAFGSKLS